MQALMLAAGMGRRMENCTDAIAKCMVTIGGKTLLERTVDALKQAEISKLVVVVGWNCNQLVKEIQSGIAGVEFEFVYNFDYASTNNIYSLYLARAYLERDDTILIESDLIYDKQLIQEVARCPDQDLAVVSKFEPWMDGTVTTITRDGEIDAFIGKKDINPENAASYYKTVNIYKFSKPFLQKHYVPQLEKYITEHGRNEYYEMVLRELTKAGEYRLKAFVLKDIAWYEIDNSQDLAHATAIFGQIPKGAANESMMI